MQLFLLITIAFIVSLVGGVFYKNVSKIVFVSTAVTVLLYTAIYFIQGGTLSAWLSIAIFIQLVISFLVCYLVTMTIHWFKKMQSRKTNV
jgi:hypothetical protein